MLKPLGDRVLIRPIKNADETESGLVLVEHRKPETMGEVVAVGFCAHPRKAEVNELADRLAPLISDLGLDFQDEIVDTLRGLVAREPLVKAGDTVVFSWTAGREVTLDDEDRYLIMSESDILAVLEPEPAPALSIRHDFSEHYAATQDPNV